MVPAAGIFINLLMASLPHARVTSSLFLLCLHLGRAQFAGFFTPTLPCQEAPAGDQSLLPSGNQFPKYSHLADFYGLPFQRTMQGLLWGVVLESAQNHRTNPKMIWTARDLRDYLIPTPSHEQSHLPLDHVASSPVQLGFEHFQAPQILQTACASASSPSKNFFLSQITPLSI